MYARTHSFGLNSLARLARDNSVWKFNKMLIMLAHTQTHTPWIGQTDCIQPISNSHSHTLRVHRISPGSAILIAHPRAPQSHRDSDSYTTQHLRQQQQHIRCICCSSIAKKNNTNKYILAVCPAAAAWYVLLLGWHCVWTKEHRRAPAHVSANIYIYISCFSFPMRMIDLLIESIKKCDGLLKTARRAMLHIYSI